MAGMIEFSETPRKILPYGKTVKLRVMIVVITAVIGVMIAALCRTNITKEEIIFATALISLLTVVLITGIFVPLDELKEDQ